MGVVTIKTYFGFARNGSATNFLSVIPRRRDVSIGIKVTNTDEVDSVVRGTFGGKYHENSGWYTMSIKDLPDKNDENLEALKPVFAQAEKEFFKK